VLKNKEQKTPLGAWTLKISADGNGNEMSRMWYWDETVTEKDVKAQWQSWTQFLALLTSRRRSVKIKQEGISQ